jgi:TrmH family RNA methyltransferase
MPVSIRSTQNRQIKNIVKLRRRRQRDSQQMTVVEGVRESLLSLRSGIIPREAYICRAVADTGEISDLAAELDDLESRGKTRLFDITLDVFARIAYRSESGGVLLVVPYRALLLSDLHLGACPFLAVVEDVEKPGNLGAILRSADAAGLDGVIVCSSHARSGGTDVHNPNVIRASLGTLFSVPIAVSRTDEVISLLAAHEIQTVAASPSASLSYAAVDFAGPVALVMGSEARGLSDRWLTAADKRVMIPMHGVVDSLNLAVSTALLMYEVVRQRASANNINN